MNRYLLPRMVYMCTGLCGLSSSFWRSQATCTSRVRDEPSLLYSQTGTARRAEPPNLDGRPDGPKAAVPCPPDSRAYLASALPRDRNPLRLRQNESWEPGLARCSARSAAVGVSHCLQPGNFWRRLPHRIDHWSLTSLQQRFVKTGGRLVKHARYYWLLLAKSYLTRRLFGTMVRRIAAMPCADRVGTAAEPAGPRLIISVRRHSLSMRPLVETTGDPAATFAVGPSPSRRCIIYPQKNP
jgi:hypothetical protein